MANPFSIVETWSGTDHVIIDRDVLEVTTPDASYWWLMVGEGWSGDLFDFTYGVPSDDQPETGWDPRYEWPDDPGVLAFLTDWSLSPSVLGLNKVSSLSGTQMIAQDNWLAAKLIMWGYANGTRFDSPLLGATNGQNMTLVLVKGGHVVPPIGTGPPGGGPGYLDLGNSTGNFGDPPTYGFSNPAGGAIVGYVVGQEGESSICGFNFGTLASNAIPDFIDDFTLILDEEHANNVTYYPIPTPPCVGAPNIAYTHGKFGLAFVYDDALHPGGLTPYAVIPYGQSAAYTDLVVGGPSAPYFGDVGGIVFLGGTRVKLG